MPQKKQEKSKKKEPFLKETLINSSRINQKGTLSPPLPSGRKKRGFPLFFSAQNPLFKIDFDYGNALYILILESRINQPFLKCHKLRISFFLVSFYTFLSFFLSSISFKFRFFKNIISNSLQVLKVFLQCPLFTKPFPVKHFFFFIVFSCFSLQNCAFATEKEVKSEKQEIVSQELNDKKTQEDTPNNSTKNQDPAFFPEELDKKTQNSSEGKNTTENFNSELNFTWGTYIQAVATMLFLLLLLWYVLKLIKRYGEGRFLPNQRLLPKTAMFLEGQLSLGPNKCITVVNILEKRLVLGITENTITLLTEMSSEKNASEEKELKNHITQEYSGKSDVLHVKEDNALHEIKNNERELHEKPQKNSFSEYVQSASTKFKKQS